MKDKYEVRTITLENLTEAIIDFMYDSLKEVVALHDRELDTTSFDLIKFIKNQRLVICLKNDEPVGYMMSALTRSVFDEKVRLLKQVSLYTRPKTRAANLLMKDFIDFGRANADHVISMIGVKTNIKPQTLERLGFKHLETLYIMEV